MNDTKRETMKVLRDGKQYEVYSVPVNLAELSAPPQWHFQKTDGGGFLLVHLCTPVPEKKETDLERARGLLKEWEDVKSTHAGRNYLRAEGLANAYESEISRLTAGEWTEELVEEYAQYREEAGRCDLPYKPDVWLARRKEKEGER